MNFRGRAGAGAASALFVFVATVAGLPAQETRHAWTHPDTLRYAILQDPHSLNPVLSSSVTEDNVDALFSDLLVGTDEKGRPYPLLAQRVPSTANGDISRDGKTIVFHLRPNVKWHDGVAFTSGDVRFTWRAVMNPANNVSSRSGYDLITGIDTPDNLTAVFHLQHPYGPALATFFSGGQTVRIVPEHLLSKFPNLNTIDFNEKPIGTGPFKVVSWKRSQSIELEANDQYFLGKPKLRHITLRIIPNTTTVGVQLKTHEIDFAQLDSSTYRDLRTDPGVRASVSDQYSFAAYLLNLAKPILEDIRVRRAIAYAIDRKGIVDRATYGTGEIATGDIPPLSWGHTKNVTVYPYDPQKARDLLDQAGWKVGAKGIRSKNGLPLAIDIAEASGGATGHGINESVQQMLHDVGFDVQIRSSGPELFFAPKSEGGILAGGKFDLALITFTSSADPDNSTLFMCKYAPPNGQNYPRYCNKALDGLEERALTSYDRTSRTPLYATIEKMVTADLPMFFLYYNKNKIGMNPDLTGFSTNGITATWNAYTWSI